MAKPNTEGWFLQLSDCPLTKGQHAAVKEVCAKWIRWGESGMQLNFAWPDTLPAVPAWITVGQLIEVCGAIGHIVTVTVGLWGLRTQERHRFFIMPTYLRRRPVGLEDFKEKRIYRASASKYSLH